MLNETKTADSASSDEHYLDHLATINKDRDVVAIQDIYNTSGALLVRQGARIDYATARRLTQHKSSKPLEHQLQIEGSLTADSLNQQLQKFLEQHADLATIQRSLGADDDLALLFDKQLSPTLLQKLTVMALQQPTLLEQALFGGWLAVLLASELGLRPAEIRKAGIAALARDTGFLHLPPVLIEQGHEFSPHEWRAMQSHTVVGEIILNDTAGMDPEIGRAVLEHHEALDGSGYPAGKERPALSLLGRVVNLVDTLCAIRLKNFKDTGRNLRDTQPFLLMNSHAYERDLHDAICSILRKSGLERTSINPLGNQANLLAQLIAQGNTMRRTLPIVKELSDLISVGRTEPTARKLGRVALRTYTLITSSGLVNDEIINWLESLLLEPQADEIVFLSEIELLQKELRWHLTHLQRALTAYLNEAGPHDPSYGRLKELAVGLP
ncbi:MAG TPA: HD domain-containing phosphohydrolase [Gammaproteobacteria bacterium]|nr:HD domain-containing phosphohydrolase [Gammaproteobacteria bacterium]